MISVRVPDAYRFVQIILESRGATFVRLGRRRPRWNLLERGRRVHYSHKPVQLRTLLIAQSDLKIHLELAEMSC